MSRLLEIVINRMQSNPQVELIMEDYRILDLRISRDMQPIEKRNWEQGSLDLTTLELQIGLAAARLEKEAEQMLRDGASLAEVAGKLLTMVVEEANSLSDQCPAAQAKWFQERCIIQLGMGIAAALGRLAPGMERQREIIRKACRIMLS